ncbi:ABC transporter substrate-binding protein [Leucobacter sp. UCMA 4100]|uniref:ABC transporter substrate-binding protein n=1 Tax=Leucobacter sp. UCMA 4100 TaxID=2810534 RepID=UPI0022EAFEA4|nr:MqnA/MqnD/SBP family protein [Leucobacter sp. UCMA 4100]MDA3147955.1 ABC transporter substrate-binding protein [Leucobacter sp. UCMA 4100]
MKSPATKNISLSLSALGIVGTLLLTGCSTQSEEPKAPKEPAAEIEAPAEVHVSGPASPPSLPILRMIETDALGETDIVFERWESADQLTAAVTGGTEFVAAPLTTGATLAQGGADLQLLNVSAWAVMGLVTNDDVIETIDDLAGQTIYVAMRASAVDYTMQLVLAAHDLTDDVTIEYVDPLNGPEQFLAGQISTLVTVEPQVTMLLANSEGARSVVDFEAEWRELTDSALPLPTAGTFVNGTFAGEHAETAKAFREAYAEAAEWVAEHPDEAGQLANEKLGMPAPIVAASIPKISWEAQGAAEAKPAVELYFTQLFETWPESVGGAMPEASFYLQ